MIEKSRFEKIFEATVFCSFVISCISLLVLTVLSYFGIVPKEAPVYAITGIMLSFVFLVVLSFQEM